MTDSSGGKRMFKSIGKKLLVLTIALVMVISLTACGGDDNKVVIYTSSEDFKIEYMTQRLNEEFPDYEIVIEYIATGNHAAKLISEGSKTECDITHDLDYGYLAKLDSEGILADLSAYDKSIYEKDTVLSENYIVELRNGGAIVVNTQVLKDKGLKEPTCYEDLLKPEYKGLISMPNPKASGTGYMFLKSLVNAWGEDKAYDYFDKLTPNILQYTSSGSGPVNALVQGEAAVGFSQVAQAVTEINAGAPLKILTFDEGHPYTLYGQSIIKGKETKEAVAKVFEFLVNEYNYENNEKFFPEKIYKDKSYTVKNYPQNMKYADMSNNSISEKERLLDKWKY